MKEDERRKELCEVIVSIWDSLQSHLAYTNKPSSEGKQFHIECVVQYARDIHKLSKLL